MVSKTPTTIRPHTPTPAERASLQDHGWCTSLLQNPRFSPIQTVSRAPTNPREDTLIAETLNTPRTISTWLSFYGAPDPTTEGDCLGELRCILRCGAGLSGHPGIAHGGFISFLLDDVMGCVAGVHRSGEQGRWTAYLHVEYKRPMPLPGVILVRALLEGRSEGRKSFVRGFVEDGEGVVFAEGSCLYVDAKAATGSSL